MILNFNDLEGEKKNLLKTLRGKGENAGNKHFLLFQQYFQPCKKLHTVHLTLYHMCLNFNDLKEKETRKLCGNRRKCW